MTLDFGPWTLHYFSRAVINQSDTRLAIAARRSAEASDRLVLRGQARIRGEIGPLFLHRCWDDNGEPLGYERALLDPLYMSPRSKVQGLKSRSKVE